MRVLFFTTSGNYNGGGVMCLMETLGKLDRSTIQPHVLIPTHGTTERELKRLNIPYSVIRCYDWLFPRTYKHSVDYKIKCPLRWLVNKIAEIRIKRLFVREQIEAYHLNSIYNDCGVKSAKKLGIPVIWHLREFVTDDDWSPVFVNEKKAYRKIQTADIILSVSDCIKEYYQEKMPGSNIITVYDGVDCSNLIPCGHIQEFRMPIRLGMVGGVAPVKGHEDAIRAVAELKRRGVCCQLEIIGRYRDGQYKSILDKIIEDSNVTDLVHFYGNCENMKDKWGDIDILLVCSRSESFGRVAVEAMYQGIPIIAANNTGSKELIEDEKYGWLYETNNYMDLANCVDNLIKTGNAINRNYTVNRAKTFSIENNAKSITRIITSLR